MNALRDRSRAALLLGSALAATIATTGCAGDEADQAREQDGRLPPSPCAQTRLGPAGVGTSPSVEIQGVGTSPSLEVQGVGTSPSILSRGECDAREDEPDER